MDSEAAPWKRKNQDDHGDSNKAQKLNNGSTAAGGAKKMSFAEKMMAKMGYQKGSGLGKDGEGIINPIEIKMRPQGAGVGTVKEKTDQHKAEEKRKAEAAGEEYVDSSEEERRARKARKEKIKKAQVSKSGGGGVGGAGKKKQKYKTVADVQAAAPGLDVPQKMLGLIVDATGSQTKLLNGLDGLTPAQTPNGFMAAETEADKIAKREKQDLEAFIDSWHALQERKIHIEEHQGQHVIDAEQKSEDVERLQHVIDAVEGLRLAPVDRNNLSDDSAISRQWDDLIEKLDAFQEKHRHDVKKFNLAQATVGTMHPIFKQQMDVWDPLEEPAKFSGDLETIKAVLGLAANDEITFRNDFDIDGNYGKSRRQKATTAYETMVYTIWLNKIRSAVNRWDVHDPSPMVILVQAWRPLLPVFVYNSVIDQLIVPKLISALRAWTPRRSRHHHKSSSNKQALPHSWLFPWLEYLPAYHLDLNAPTSLAIEAKSKLKQAFEVWDISSGAFLALDQWHMLLQTDLDHALVRHILPKLAKHLAANFRVDPADQDLTPLEQVLAWQTVFPLDTMARLLVAELFPEWLGTLHMWLTNEGVKFDEISDWYTWWKEQIPEKLNRHPQIQEQWQKGQEMIGQAMTLFDEGRINELPAPVTGPAPAVKEAKKPHVSIETTVQRPPPETSFKDIVEQWCVEQDLLLVPLKEAHAKTGLPLFRLTASVTGKGGVPIYLQGDIVWVQRKGDRSSFDPMGLDDELVARAEGR